MPKFDAVIFDMDGTLVDSEVLWEEAEGEMFAERGLDYTDEVREQVIGLRLDEFFTKLINIYELDETVDDLIHELEERMLVLIAERAIPKPGANELIDWVREMGLPYCIASSSSQNIIEAVVKSQPNWVEWFAKRYSADLVALGKPAPDVYLYAAEQLGVDPTKCLALEDSSTGAKAAVAAGMTCYAIPDFHTPHEKFADITPHVFNDMHEILALLREE